MENTPNLEDISDLIFFTNRALQGEVRPNMRKVSIQYIKEEKRFILYLYYDKPLTQEELDYDVAGGIIAEISSNFPNSIDISWDDKIIVLPYPKKLPDEGICIFRRFEHTPTVEN